MNSAALSPSPGIGHNAAAMHDDARADVAQRVDAALQAADVWQGRDAFDRAQAEKAVDYIAGVKKLMREADEARKTETRPHREAEKAVNEWWGALTDKLAKALKFVEPKLDAYKRALAAEQERKRREAQEAQRAADEAARAAAADAARAQSASQQIEAEARQQELERQAAEAARAARAASAPVMIESATGLANRSGLRTTTKARLDNVALAAAYYRQHPELHALLLKLANADYRHAPTVEGEKQPPVIPGVTFVTE